MKNSIGLENERLITKDNVLQLGEILAVSAVKNFDEETKKLYNSVTEKKSLVQALKTTLAARTNRREELKAEALDKYNIAAETEARKMQFEAECGYSTYEALLAAYNNLLTEN